MMPELENRIAARDARLRRRRIGPRALELAVLAGLSIWLLASSTTPAEGLISAIIAATCIAPVPRTLAAALGRDH